MRESLMDVPPLVLAYRVVHCWTRLVPVVLVVAVAWPFASGAAIPDLWGTRYKLELERAQETLKSAVEQSERDKAAEFYADLEKLTPESSGFRYLVASSYGVRGLLHSLWMGALLYYLLWHVLGPPFGRVSIIRRLQTYFLPAATVK